mgnify:CR=1 FL=1
MPHLILSTLNARYAHASLGLRYLFANLDDELRAETKIVEFVIGSKTETLVEQLLAFSPKVIGFGVYIWNVEETTKLIAMLKAVAAEIKVVIGGPVQRFRWIEPGEFVMGSPEGEVGRLDREGPQHVVRVTEGFWLAETACSQGVWESVMGSNPSRFKDDPQNPVEQVSWDDVQGFLREVEKRMPGVKAALPTEAEWEYACRAGSKTAFNWGDGIDPSRANYDGTYSYADGPTGEYREKTVPVKSFEPNAWGLYQMHGNVDEWCSDGMRKYDGASQVDPRGPTGDEPDAPRALRGGSWNSRPARLRAAFRNDWPRGERLDLQGFRFSLRSTSSAERSPEATVAPEGPDRKSVV